MEGLGKQSDLITRMSNIYWIIPFYDYAYDSVRVLRSLCQDTRYLWVNEQDVIIKMFQKQTIHIKKNQQIDKKTIATLKKANKYKLFKLDFEIC